jgi:hypothetical protein
MSFEFEIYVSSEIKHIKLDKRLSRVSVRLPGSEFDFNVKRES